LMTLVVATALTALVCVLLTLALFTSEPEAPAPTVALTTIVPEVPALTSPATASVDDFTLANVSCCPLCPGVTTDPLRVALPNVTPAGSVSITCVPVALVWPVLEKVIVYWIGVDTPPVTLAWSTVFDNGRLAGGVTQKSAR